MFRLTEEMFAVGKPARQGEVYIWMKQYAPRSVLTLVESGNAEEMKLGGPLIIGHSETGHHHVLEPVNTGVKLEAAVQVMVDKLNDSFMELRLAQECQLLHKRGNHTHGTLIFPPGDYVRVIRSEQTVEGWRRVAD